MSKFDFKNAITINEFKLHEECLIQASLYDYYSELKVKVESERNRLKNQIKLVEAQVEVKLRKLEKLPGDVKKTDKSILSFVTKDEGVQKIKNEFFDAEEEFLNLESKIETLNQRKSALNNLVNLYIAGYYSVPKGIEKSTVDKKVSKDIRKNLNRKKGK